jgi:hypothetical protein
MHVILKANFFVANRRYRPDPAGGTIEMEDRLRPFLPSDAVVVERPKAGGPGSRAPIDSQEKHWRKAGKEYDPLEALEALKKASPNDALSFAVKAEAQKALDDEAKRIAAREAEIEAAEAAEKQAEDAAKAAADAEQAEADKAADLAEAERLKSLEDKRPVRAGKKR